MNRHLIITTSVLLLILSTFSIKGMASAVSGTMFYTTFSGGTNVHKVDYAYDGASTFSLTNNTGIAAVAGADGISGNPNDANSLFVGGQGPRIHRLSKTGALIQTLNTPTNVFHLEAANSTTLYGTDIPSTGSFTKATINPDGSLSAPTTISIVGGGGQVTQIITTPTGDYYTASGPGGNGVFGTVSIVGNIATLTQLSSGVPAAHGGVYDPFSNTIILFGDGHISQYNLAGSLISDLVLGGTFDQGTVDGKGHIFAANNNGNMTFIDYGASGLVNGLGSFASTQFLHSSLDDIAPLVGTGSTVPEPSILALIGIGFIGLIGWRRRKNS